MIPRLVTPPSDLVVSVDEAKGHCRVDGGDEDLLIQHYIDAAVVYLDGWHGVLGRCISRQVWEVDYPAAGCWRLPLPDVETVTASVGDAVLSHDAQGCTVTLTEAATVTMIVCMPETLRPTVAQIIKMLVGHWYQNREAVGGDGLQAIPMAVDALLAPIRWTRL